MKKIKSQKGQTLILIALAMVGLVGFTALAVDGGRVLSDRRHTQNAADTAALAAALAKIGGDSAYKTKAQNTASTNGYSTDADSTVLVELCSEVASGDACQGLPAGASPSQYIRVRITSIVSTTFAKVVGRSQVTNVVEAVTRVQGTTSSGSLFGGAGMVATKSDNSNQCFLLNGNADLTLHGTGIFVNCTGTEALFTNGGANMIMGDDAEIAGCARNQGGNITGGSVVCNVPQQTVGASTFADVPTTLPAPTCSSPGGQSGNTLSPGYFSGNVSMNSTTTMAPGTYCFNGGLNVNGSANLKGTGTVRMVLSGDLNLNGSSNTFDDLEVYTQNATLRVTGSLTAPRLRLFATGTGGLNIQNGTLTSGNAYFYSYRGRIEWNSSAMLNLHGPPQDDTFGGLLIYQPWGNTNAFILNGNTGSILTGTILVPTSDVTYNGGSNFELHGQVIGSTFKVNGGGHTDIWFDATENYDPGGDPTIELTW